MGGIFFCLTSEAIPASAAEVPLEQFLRRPFVSSYPLTLTDMHLIGNIKEKKQEFIVRNDDGSISTRDLEFTTFFENGRIKTDDGSNILNTAYGWHWDYLYDAANLLSGIKKNTYINHSNDIVEVSYDASGHIVKFHDKTQNSITDTDIVNFPDGRPKEAIARDGTGKGIWRIEYEYGDNTISIQEFDARLGNVLTTKSIFSIDPHGRIAAADVVESGVGFEASNTFHGTYIYAYNTDGSKYLDIDNISNYGTLPGEKCHQHREYFPNGVEDKSKIRQECRNFVLFGPGGRISKPEIVDYRFDEIGNLIFHRSGRNFTELGKPITRWNAEWISTYSYFDKAALEHHVWQDKRSFEPMSHTAQAITGQIRLSGNPQFATPGGKMTITFGNGKSSTLTSVGASWREWNDADHVKVTAEVFRLESDPGKLEHGNTLCGDPTKSPAQYIVFHEDLFLGQTPLLDVAVFESKNAPKDINSPGLCGTFSFYAK